MTKNGRYTEDEQRRRRLSGKLDKLDNEIIAALLTDAETSSTELATRFKKPLSTIQRRRSRIESGILTLKYRIEPVLGNYRRGHLFIAVAKGNTEDVARELYEQYPQVSEVTIGINSTVDIVATIYFKDTEALHKMQQEISAMNLVNEVRFYEIVKVIGHRDISMTWLMAR